MPAAQPSSSVGSSAVGRGGRALVIGHGFIGSHIVAALVAAGERPVVLTRSEPGAPVPGLPREDLRVGDAADPQTLGAALVGVDRVIYAAGGLLPAASEREPERDADMTLRPLRAVLEALRERPGALLVYLSSGGTVYGDPSKIPTAEDEEPRPRSVYGELHVRCEGEILGAVERDGLRARIMRCSTVYGEGQQPDRGQGVIATFLGRILRGDPVELYGDGSTIRDYLYVGDLARILLDLLDREDGPTVLNVGSGEGTSLADVLGLVEAELGREADVIRHPERDFDVHQIVLDITRLRELVPVSITPIAEGIGRTGRWLASDAAREAA